jgi:hypothetical protein
MGAHGSVTRGNPLRALLALMRGVYQNGLVRRIGRRLRHDDVGVARSSGGD